MQTKPGTTPLEANPVTHKFSTVALVPLSDDVPLSAFAYEIYHSLCAIGPTLRLTSDDVRRALGPGILEPNYEYRLTSWLAQQGTVIYLEISSGFYLIFNIQHVL